MYLLQGVTVNDYVGHSHRDAYDEDFLGTLLDDCKTTVDVIHGRRVISLGRGLGSGSYRKDISDWVLGYIVGMEWDTGVIAYTNLHSEAKNAYQGEYLYTSAEASPFEAFLAQVGDRMIAYESRQYGQQRLISFYNTAATDPFSYPELVARKEQKFATLDVEQIQSTKKYRAGQFASYTVHLFSPDYLTEMEKAALCSEGEIQNRMGVLELQLLLRRIANMEAPPISAYLPANWQSGDCHYPAYFSYIKALNAYHTMPVVISEFGVTTGRGMEQAYEALGLNDGHTSEQRQGEVLANCYEDLKAAGSAGGCVFSWQDEWQKRNWNTIYATDTDNTAYWHDAQTRDQYFGLLAFDPGESRRCCVVDGNCAEWSAADQILERGGITLSAKYDEEYLYLRLHKDDLALEQDVFYLPIDVTPKSGSTFASDQHVSFERGADFLLVLNGKENTRILVQKRYELLRAAYGEVFYSYNPYENQPDGADGEFQPIWLPIELEGLLPAWSGRKMSFCGTKQESLGTEMRIPKGRIMILSLIFARESRMWSCASPGRC